MDLDAELLQEASGEGAGGDTGGALPGAGALQDVARILPVVLGGAGGVRVAGPQALTPFWGHNQRLPGIALPVRFWIGGDDMDADETPPVKD